MIIRTLTRTVGWAGRRVATRSRWVAQRLWIVAAAQVALIANRHWRRLEPEERRRLRELLVKSKGRPSKLTARDRQEVEQLLQKLDYAELGGNVATTLLPFRPLGRLVEWTLRRFRGPEHHPAGRADAQDLTKTTSVGPGRERTSVRGSAERSPITSAAR